MVNTIEVVDLAFPVHPGQSLIDGKLGGIGWKYEGGELVPPAEGPNAIFIPQVVSRFQGREAMWQTSHGNSTLFEAAEAIINDPGTPDLYRRAWADLQEFRRDSEMLNAIATILGLSSEDLDAIFILGASIEA